MIQKGSLNLKLCTINIHDIGHRYLLLVCANCQFSLDCFEGWPPFAC